MTRTTAYAAAALILLGVSVARSGHELPVYPSYYPHEIQLDAMAPDQAAELLAQGKLHAYLGAAPRFAGAPPATVRAIESLGSLITIRVNPSSAHASDDSSRCGLVGIILREAASRGGEWQVHPYPVTPLHGDYLHHADRAATALAAFAGSAADVAGLKVRATSPLTAALIHPEWQAETDWDAEIAEIGLDDLTGRAGYVSNGWHGPPWLRAGWFHAVLLLGPAPDAARTDGMIGGLQRGDHVNPAERINLERDLVAALGAGCRATVAGYTVRREYVNVEFSTGIENIGFDWLDGLASGIFLRTAKLKDFPWNGWLALGMNNRPDAAWNPVAGFTDRFGQLVWSAVGDAALLPSPYGPGWMINRTSEIQTSGGR